MLSESLHRLNVFIIMIQKLACIIIAIQFFGVRISEACTFKKKVKLFELLSS